MHFDIITSACAFFFFFLKSKYESRLRVVRVAVDGGERVVGVRYPEVLIPEVEKTLKEQKLMERLQRVQAVCCFSLSLSLSLSVYLAVSISLPRSLVYMSQWVILFHLFFFFLFFWQLHWLLFLLLFVFFFQTIAMQFLNKSECHLLGAAVAVASM